MKILFRNNPIPSNPPFSTPPNALIMSAGRYTFGHYIKFGLPLQVVIGIVIVMVLLPVESTLLKEAPHLPMPHDQIFEHPVWRDVKFMNDAVAAIERLAPELQVTPVLLEGRAKDVILDEAEQRDADLIYGGIPRLRDY